MLAKIRNKPKKEEHFLVVISTIKRYSLLMNLIILSELKNNNLNDLGKSFSSSLRIMIRLELVTIVVFIM